MFKNLLSVVLLLGLSSSVLLGMDGLDGFDCQKTKAVLFRPIDKIPAEFSFLTKELFTQSKKDGEYELSGYNSNTLDLMYFLSVNLDEKCRRYDHWAIHASPYPGFELDRLVKDSEHIDETTGIRAYRVWYPEWNYPLLQSCLDGLELKFKEIIEMLKSGWIFVPDGHSTDAFVGYFAKQLPVADFFLFVKNKQLCWESDLILKLVKRFGIEHIASHDDSCNQVKEGKVCLLIRRDEFDKFMAHFGFRSQEGDLLTVS